MRFIALLIALGGLGLGAYTVIEDLPNYNYARGVWMSMPNDYNNPSYISASELRDHYYNKMETQGIATIGAAVLGLILSLIAMRKQEGRGIAVLALLASIGAGVCGGIIGTSPGIF
jgi:hypothetical protein